MAEQSLVRTPTQLERPSLAHRQRAPLKLSGTFFPTDMRDDSAIYDAISTKLHVDAEHIAREPVPSGIRLAAMQCIIGSAWRHHASGMCPPTLDQARRTQVHLCRLTVRAVLAVPATAPIELTGDSGTAPELLALPIAAGGFAICLSSLNASSCAMAVGTIVYLALPSSFRLSKDGWLPPQPRAHAWST